MTKKIACLLIAALLLFTTGSYAAATAINDTIDEIQEYAEADGYRFILVGEDGITDEIRDELAENDALYIDDTPTGSVKVIVLDAETGKPVNDAKCMLTFHTSRYTVTSDGSHDQIANPFLLFDLGKTPEDGEILFTDTFFYSTRKVEPDDTPFVEILVVWLADIVDKNPELTIDYDVQSGIASNEPELFQEIVGKLEGQTTLKFSELKSVVQEVAEDRYSELIRSLFDNEFVIFSDSVTVKVPDKPQFEKLISEGMQELTIKELRAYVDENRELFIKYVANRYYDDFGGYEPSFIFDYNPEYDFVRTYKDGTQKNETKKPYLGMYIFDFESTRGGTGYAINKDSFTYNAYVYADGYKEGKAIGASIRQDLVDKDITIKVYLSKDMSPVIVYDKSNAIFGTLFDSEKNPIADAEIQIQGTDYKATTDEEGNFSFSKLELDGETVHLTIIDPENGDEMPASAIVDGKKYELNSIPVDLSREDGVYRLTLVNGDPGEFVNSNPGEMVKGGGLSLPVILIIAAVAILLIALGIVIGMSALKKKKKNAGNFSNAAPVTVKRFCHKCGSPLRQDDIFCENCGTRIQ